MNRLKLYASKLVVFPRAGANKARWLAIMLHVWKWQYTHKLQAKKGDASAADVKAALERGSTQLADAGLGITPRPRPAAAAAFLKCVLLLDD